MNRILKHVLWLAALFGAAGRLQAQSSPGRVAIASFLEEQIAKGQFAAGDLREWELTDEYRTEHNGILHVYLRQLHRGLPVWNGLANFNLSADGKVLSMGDRLARGLAQSQTPDVPTLSAAQAVEAVARYFRLSGQLPAVLRASDDQREWLFAGGDYSKKEIPVRLGYWYDGEGVLRLVWDLSVYAKDGRHWWNVRIDALDGGTVAWSDWVKHCDFGSPGTTCNHPLHGGIVGSAPTGSPLSASGTYNVFALPVESPNHGGRSLVISPADALASPYGWHDTNGAAGAEHTITRGNNVYAYEDRADADQPGYSPNGGALLNFDFPLNLNQAPINYQDAAITNLFYMNNMMHDVWYRYGFTEAAGNFQSNNYGRGGTGNDEVLAEAQDGGGTNNANFAAPPDGSSGVMQMYLWTGAAASAARLDIAAPAGIAGSYSAIEATFGPGITAPITADLVLSIDNTAPTDDACNTIVNAAALNGKIAIALRGTCNFVTKVQALQNAGAVAVIIINNTGAAPIPMGGTSATINIPSVMISQADGNLILAQLAAGNTVSGTLQPSASGGNFDRDGDFDNGVVAHEYGHGISIRLTGGPSNSDCLDGDEQPGEGWSDWFATILTMQPSHTAATPRPMGTYASGEAPTGTGIRPAPYSTDFAVNNYTYANVANQNISVPHGVGFIWATMLWDLTWAFIDQYGYDADIYTGNGGNNRVMRLVMDGMKLQPCNPGFVDCRNAILQADQINYGGANQCLIWEVFARRGLGAGASQGSPLSRSDQTAAFDIPLACQIPTVPPTAAFTSALGSSCSGTVYFTDNSTDVPQQWNWDFGDGNASTAQNPTHTYASSGLYTVRLIVTNVLGADTIFQTVHIQYPPAPQAADATICAGTSATLNATASGTAQWSSQGGMVLATGNTFNTPVLNATTSYTLQNLVTFPSQFVGPSNTNFGTGGYHGTAFTGTVNFTALQALEIRSALVDANGAGNRTFFLWGGPDGTGSVLAQITVNVPNGQSRVQLNFSVPAPGNYSIGATNAQLYRNNAGANYPYTLAGLISLTGSSAGGDFYYYLYDLEVRPASCSSPSVPVTVFVEQAGFNYQASGVTGIQFSNTSTGATSWFWDFGDGNTSTDANPLHDYGQTGTYTVTLTINGTCSLTAQVTTGTSAVVGQNSAMTALLYPNPAAGVAYLQSDLAAGTALRLTDALGRLLRVYTVESDIQILDLKDLPAGTYSLLLPEGGALRLIVRE